MQTMNFTEFQNWVGKEIRPLLSKSYQDAEIRFDRVEKLSGSYDAMFIHRSDDSVVPAINLSSFYEEYMNGKPERRLLEDIKRSAEERSGLPDISWLDDYEKVKKKLFIRISSVRENLRQNVPHRIVENLMITYHVLLRGLPHNCASVIVTESMRNLYGISSAKLHQDALKNSVKIMPYTLEKADDFIARNPDRFFQGDAIHFDVYLLSNIMEINGAASIFYPGMTEKIAAETGGSYYALPSSIHEWIIVPDNGGISWVDLEDTVYKINRLVVAREERLSDRAYYYDASARLFTLAANRTSAA